MGQSESKQMAHDHRGRPWQSQKSHHISQCPLIQKNSCLHTYGLACLPAGLRPY